MYKYSYEAVSKIRPSSNIRSLLFDIYPIRMAVKLVDESLMFHLSPKKRRCFDTFSDKISQATFRLLDDMFSDTASNVLFGMGSKIVLLI